MAEELTKKALEMQWIWGSHCEMRFFFGCWSCHDSCWECVPGLVEFFGGLRISWNNCELVRADLSCLLVFGKALNQISLRFLASAMVKHYNQLWLWHFLGPGAHHKPFFPSNMSSTLTTSWSLYLNKILGQKLGDSKAPHSSHNMMQGNTPNPMASLVRMFQTLCSKAVAQPTLKGNVVPRFFICKARRTPRWIKKKGIGSTSFLKPDIVPHNVIIPPGK